MAMLSYMKIMVLYIVFKITMLIIIIIILHQNQNNNSGRLQMVRLKIFLVE
jgi:hypothetical protein